MKEFSPGVLQRSDFQRQSKSVPTVLFGFLSIRGWDNEMFKQKHFRIFGVFCGQNIEEWIVTETESEKLNKFIFFWNKINVPSIMVYSICSASLKNSLLWLKKSVFLLNSNCFSYLAKRIKNLSHRNILNLVEKCVLFCFKIYRISGYSNLKLLKMDDWSGIGICRLGVTYPRWRWHSTLMCLASS